jgi:hypothetical protein
MQDIADWLEALGMPEYAERFAENGIDVSALRYLTDRLTEREVGAIIDRIVGNKPRPASIRQDIIERTDGIPLFVEEMTKAVGEGASGAPAAPRRSTNGRKPPSETAKSLARQRRPPLLCNPAGRRNRPRDCGRPCRDCGEQRRSACKTDQRDNLI